MAPRSSKNKVQKVMHEFKTGTLHTGSKKGPIVKNPKQAIAIALSEAGKSKGRTSPKPNRKATRQPLPKGKMK